MMEKPGDSELMQHADGELGERASDVSGALDRDAIARAKADALGELRELVRGHLELSADEVDDRKFQAMWRDVAKSIDAPVGIWARIGAWLDRHRGHLVTGAVSAGAVAALALVLRPGDRATDASGGRGIDVQPVSVRQPPAIESLDTPDGTGTILNLEDEDGHTAVIWVTPADTVEGI
jgi:hypothetical protein